MDENFRSMTSPTEGQIRNRLASQSSTHRRGLKWLGIIGAIVLLLLLSVVLLLTIFFPSELVRKELEVRLSDTLQGTIRIDSLSFNLITGLKLKEVTFSKDDQSLLALDALILDYSLLELLRQRLQINEIRLDGADDTLDEIGEEGQHQRARRP